MRPLRSGPAATNAYTGHSPIANSEFNRVSTAYLRLKSLELGYTIPRISKFSSVSLRVYANAYNLFTITGVKFVDPEHPDDRAGPPLPAEQDLHAGTRTLVLTDQNVANYKSDTYEKDTDNFFVHTVAGHLLRGPGPCA